MNIFEVMEKRYSHKEGFLPNPVPLADLEKIAKAGLSAPTGVNRQIVKLIILPDRAALDPINALAPHIGLDTAPAAIAIITDDSFASEGRFNFEKEDYAAAITSMSLAATAMGYSSLWLDSPYFDPAREAATLKALGVPEGFRLWCVMPIGKPDGEGSRREKLHFEARVSYGKYGVQKA